MDSFVACNTSKAEHDSVVVEDPGEVLTKSTEDKCSSVKCVRNTKTLSRPRRWGAWKMPVTQLLGRLSLHQQN